MQRKIYHLYLKDSGLDYYYYTLSALCKNHKEIQISVHTLYRYDFKEPYQNRYCIIKRGIIN